MTPRVTVNAGLRWDPYFPPYAVLPIFGHFDKDRFDRGLRSTTFPNGPAGMVFQGDPEFLSGRFHRLQAVERLGAAARQW